MGVRPRGLYEVLIAMQRYSEQHIFDEMQLNDFYWSSAMSRLSTGHCDALITE